MKINLEELQHQRDALDAILKYFPKRDYHTAVDLHGVAATDAHANPILKCAYNKEKFIDVKMETGTGKTYVYTRMMYELNEELGLTKFIVVVPSLAIKAGSKSFMSSDYAKQHFSQFFPNKRLQVYEIKSGDFAKKNGRYQLSNDLVQFTSAMTTDKNTIHVLLISDKGYLDKATSSLFKSHYDQSLFNSARTPAEAILMTRPIIIIDEPHRFKREGKSYENIINQLDPQIIVRFGATFPLIEKGKRKGEVDYYSKNNPVYDLNAINSFNNGLVKGVEVVYPSLKDADSPKYRVKSVTNKTLTLTKDGKDFELAVGDNLNVILNDNNFDGDVTYDGNKELSTGMELSNGMELVAGIFDNSYQEIMLAQLIHEHFEKEQDGFLRNGYRVKTISLVFIDSISSYRNDNGWLRSTFEKLLKSKVDELLEVYKNPQDKNETDYFNYLLVTKASLQTDAQEVHGGYFASDWGEPDDSAVTSERLDILQKERTLTFKKPDGSWNLRRFFFSKWTLREGWDNPNVFVIAKLRSSGSEISKLQEVGRGLRLPVDEAGRRISNEELYVSYIVDFSEREFASKLVGEINSDKKFKIEMNAQITEAVVQTLIENGYEASSMHVKMKLNDAGIIDDNEKVIDTEALFALLPRVSNSKVRERPNGKKVNNEIRLKRENWNEIKEFWQDISRRYMVRYHDISEIDLRKIIEKVLDYDVLVNPKMSVTHEKTQRGYEGIGIIRESRSVGYEVEINVSQINFGEFLSRVASITNLPIRAIYEPIAKKLSFYGSEAKKYVNTVSLSRFKMFWSKPTPPQSDGALVCPAHSKILN